MARLRCASRAERLLIPAFVLFFFLLYPMRWANRPGGGSPRPRAAASWCGPRRWPGRGASRPFAAPSSTTSRWRGAVKRAGGATRLALSLGAVASLRPYPDVGAVWRMVRRSAFTQLRRSWALLAAVVAGLLLMFAVPPACVAAGLAGAAAGAARLGAAAGRRGGGLDGHGPGRAAVGAGLRPAARPGP